MRKANPNTHQDCRSLLQKAVRRGDCELVVKVADHLYEIGDMNWLKQRTGVIIAEECYPLMGEWELPLQKDMQLSTMKEILSQAASYIKFKDAAGLGSLAYALSEGDDSVLNGSDEDIHIRHICAAIEKKDQYWRWIISQCPCDMTKRFVERSIDAYRKGGWPWDKAFIQASAYLVVMVGLPKLQFGIKEESKFPFWVALDRHTPQGKAVISKLAKEGGFPWRQLNWVSFYCESGVVYNQEPSKWWDREVEWRLSKVGLSIDAAESMWTKARPRFIELLRDESKRLEHHVNWNSDQTNSISESSQLSLF